MIGRTNSAGVMPQGTINITENGTYSISSFSQAIVSVSGMIPSGTLNISENGLYDVGSYASANVNVAGSGDELVAQILEKTVVSLNTTASYFGSSTLAGCSTLEKLSAPFCTQAYYYAFWGCNNLSEVYIPKVSSFGYGTFSNTAIKSLYLEASKLSFGTYAFGQCSSLTRIDAPNATEVILTGAFTQCSQLSQVTFLSTGAIVGVSSYFFYNCPLLSGSAKIIATTSLYTMYLMNNAINYLKYYVCNRSYPFLHLTMFNASLSSFNVIFSFSYQPQGSPTFAFQGMQSLNITKIDETTFSYKDTYGSFSKPNFNMTGNSCFRNTPISIFSLRGQFNWYFSNFMFTSNQSIQHIFVKSVTGQFSTGNSMCYDCSNLETFIAGGKGGYIMSNAFKNCVKLSYFYMSELWYSGPSAFENCYCLRSIVGLGTVETNAFKNCTALESVYCFAMGSAYNSQYRATLNNANAFEGTPIADSSILGHYGSIYVPAHLYSSYITATNWVVYSDRIVSLNDTEFAQLKSEYRSVMSLDTLFTLDYSTIVEPEE